MTLGRESLRRVQERSTLSEDEAIELGVRAVREARHKR
jgi:20S proteasome alpha/beta subunit